jgi:hypothetical protein
MTVLAKPLTDAQKQARREAKAKFMATPGAKEKQRLACLAWKSNHPVKWILTRAKNSAASRNLEFTVTEADFEDLPTHCPILGLELKYSNAEPKKGDPAIASLDRKDNSKGYVPGNVFIISHKANTLKGSASLAELEALLKYMKE